MSRYYPVIMTLCAVLGVLLLWSTGVQSALFGPTPVEQSLGTPKLRVTQSRQDVGNIPAGKTAQVTFQIDNEGVRRLILRKETGHCCGQGGPEEITLVPPGGSAKLTVEVDTTGIRGGLQQEIVYATNDPQVPELRLTVVAEVE